jgi:hypothetical protein
MKWISIAFITIFLSFRSDAQDSTLLVINLPKEFQNSNVAVKLNLDKSSFLTASTPKFATFRVPAIDSTTKISIEFFNVGWTSHKWEGDFKLIGSSKTEVFLTDAGGLSLKQWPKVEFESASSASEVKLNGDVIGSTSCSKTVAPNTEHTVEWVGTKCSIKIKLGYNQKRKYTCNSDGTITEN